MSHSASPPFDCTAVRQGPGLTDDPATIAATHDVRVEFWRIIRDTLADASSPGG